MPPLSTPGQNGEVPYPEPAPRRLSHVLVVDADRRVRQSVSDLIGVAEDLELTSAVADRASAMISLEAHPADIVLIDPNLPDERSGLALLEAMRTRWPEMAVVVMSSSANVELHSMALGAVAFMPKAGDPESLLDVLRRAADRRAAA